MILKELIEKYKSEFQKTTGFNFNPNRNSCLINFDDKFEINLELREIHNVIYVEVFDQINDEKKFNLEYKTKNGWIIIYGNDFKFSLKLKYLYLNDSIGFNNKINARFSGYYEIIDFLLALEEYVNTLEVIIDVV